MKIALHRQISGFTLPEVVTVGAITVIALTGMIHGYVNSSKTAELAAYHTAAHSIAMQRIEQCRAAQWDLGGSPGVDELVPANFPTVIEVLDIPISGTNLVYATNSTQITTVSASPPLKMIRVDCVWSFNSRKVFTNSIATFRGPDQ